MGFLEVSYYYPNFISLFDHFSIGNRNINVPWCLFYIVNFQISIASSEVSARTGKVGTGAWSERLPMNL